VRLGLGKQAQDDHYTAAENVSRKKLEVEIQAGEAPERKERREVGATCQACCSQLAWLLSVPTAENWQQLSFLGASFVALASKHLGSMFISRGNLPHHQPCGAHYMQHCIQCTFRVCFWMLVPGLSVCEACPAGCAGALSAAQVLRVRSSGGGCYAGCCGAVMCSCCRPRH
jgi:hypothetical protein